MFLSRSPARYSSYPTLIDQDMNYYGFLESTEYNNWIKSLEGEIRTSDIYDSPYFGFQSSGAYRELDTVYELYKSNLPKTQAALAQRERALVAVRALYLQVLEREGDQAGLDYFADRFGDVIDPDELQIFTDMSQAEIQARDQYLADMAASARGLAELAAAQAAAEAALAASLAADAAKAKAVLNKAADQVTGGGGISPALILVAAAAFFFAG